MANLIDDIKAKIQEMEKEIQQLNNREKRLMQEHKQLERKARTRRLIERGAILESLIPDAETLTNEQVKAVLLMAFHTTAVLETLKIVRETGG